MSDDDVRRDGSGACIAERPDRIRKFFRIDLAARLSLPLVSARLEPKVERFETRAHHHGCDLRRDETRVECIWRVKRNLNAFPQHRIEKRKKNVFRFEQQRIIVVGNVSRPKPHQITKLVHAMVQWPACEAGIDDGNRAIAAAEWASFGDLQYADLRIDAFP